MASLFIDAITDRGLVREKNEDCYDFFSFDDNFHFLIVCDGVGGVAGGAIAAKTATETACESVRSVYRPDISINEIYRLMDNTIARMNSAVHTFAQEKQEYSSMCTTAVIAMCMGNHCYIGSVGDSRAYVFSENKLKLLTKDHTVAQMLLDKQCITEDEAENHSQKHKLTQAVGVDTRLSPSYTELDIKHGDALLLCTDGLHGMLDAELLEKTVAEAVSEKNVNILVSAALQAGGNDNITAVLAVF